MSNLFYSIAHCIESRCSEFNPSILDFKSNPFTGVLLNTGDISNYSPSGFPLSKKSLSNLSDSLYQTGYIDARRNRAPFQVVGGVLIFGLTTLTGVLTFAAAYNSNLKVGEIFLITSAVSIGALVASIRTKPKKVRLGRSDNLSYHQGFIDGANDRRAQRILSGFALGLLTTLVWASSR